MIRSWNVHSVRDEVSCIDTCWSAVGREASLARARDAFVKAQKHDRKGIASNE